MSDHYDLIVIGGGSAARDAARRASEEFGASVALVERVRWGGSCPNVACKPTKAYLVAAELLHEINRLADTLGIDVGPAGANLRRIRARKDALKTPQAEWVENLRRAGFEPVAGEARLVAAGCVSVGARELRADRVLIASGSRTAVPRIDGIDEIDWIDHVSALELDEVPPALLVLGAGPVGLELAQAFSRFGSRVTIVGSATRVAARADAQAAEELGAALADEGIELLLGTTVDRFGRAGAGAVAIVGPRRLRVDRVLLASGRVPNVEGLGLAAVGVETTRIGIAVDERMRTSVDGIWAAGDVTGAWQFTPLAQYEARVAVDDMFGREARAHYAEVPSAIFTDPELGSIGLTEEQARAEGLDVDTVVHPVSAVQRAAYTNTRRGLFKLVFETGSRRVLGVHVVSRGASDIVQGLALALRFGATIDDFAGVHHAFPTFGEGLKAAAEQARPAASVSP